MEITEHSPDVLVVHQGAWLVRGIGAMFAASGLGVIALVMYAPRANLHGSVWVGYVVGTMFALLGLVFVATGADQLVVFDRTAGVVRLIARGLRGRTVSEYRLADVRDVALEADRAGAHATMWYRPVLLLADGRQIAWTSVSTSDGRGQAACVAAARAFGNWDASASTLPPSPALPAVQTIAPGNFTVAKIFVAVFGLIGASVFGTEVFRVSTWRPLPATIMTSSVAAVDGLHGSASYRPAVSYWYRVGGRQYVATGVMPITISRGYTWAASVSARFPAGAAATAYVDPSDPRRAFLVHEVSLLPLVFVAVALGITGVLLLMARGTNRQRQQVGAGDFGVPVVPRSVSALG